MGPVDSKCIPRVRIVMHVISELMSSGCSQRLAEGRAFFVPFRGSKAVIRDEFRLKHKRSNYVHKQSGPKEDFACSQHKSAK